MFCLRFFVLARYFKYISLMYKKLPNNSGRIYPIKPKIGILYHMNIRYLSLSLLFFDHTTTANGIF